MARDDDDDDDRPRKKPSREVEDDDRPRKKSAREEEDERVSIAPKPMPMRLVGAIIAAMAWGILSLYLSCVDSSRSVVHEIQVQKAQREAQENIRKMQEQARAAGFNQQFDAGDFGGGSGLRYTIVGTKFFFMLMSAALVIGGSVLLMRKSLGKFIALGAPVGMLLIEFIGFVICLIISKGSFLTEYNVEFFINIVFSLAVAGCIAFLLLNKDVSKALR